MHQRADHVLTRQFVIPTSVALLPEMSTATSQGAGPAADLVVPVLVVEEERADDQARAERGESEQEVVEENALLRTGDPRRHRRN